MFFKKTLQNELLFTHNKLFKKSAQDRLKEKYKKRSKILVDALGSVKKAKNKNRYFIGHI